MEIRNANEQQSRSERGKREGSGSSTTASPSKGESKISDSKTPLEGSDHESSRRDSDKERKRDNRDHDKGWLETEYCICSVNFWDLNKVTNFKHVRPG